MHSGDRRYFFLHVMKTGGTTFDTYVRQNFSTAEIYGYDHVASDIERHRNYINLQTLLANMQGVSRGARFIRGHFPFVATRLVESCNASMVILREPVDRTISWLHHCQRHHPEHRAMQLEEIYEDEWFFSTFIHNYQLKLFAMTTDEALAERTWEPNGDPSRAKGTARYLFEGLGVPRTEFVEIDESRFELAKRNLATVDVVGFSDQFEEFLDKLEQQFGWRFKRGRRHRNTSERTEVTQALRRRIERDLEADIEFHDAARELVATR